MRFAMKGSDHRTVHASHSRTELEIRGHFHLQGPQVVGGEGGAPEWVAEAFDASPEVQIIAIGYKGGGCVYQRMSQEPTPEPTP